MAATDRADKQLIDAYLSGDVSSFDLLYDRYRRPLYSYLNKLLPGQTATADDLFQKTWMKALANLARYQDQQTFFSWLVRIAHNSAIDHFRREGKASHVDVDELSLAADGGAPWEALSDRELSDALSRAIATLPPDQREVLLLRRQGVPFKAIAEVQGSTLNTVLGRMHYAVNKLRQQLTDWTT